MSHPPRNRHGLSRNIPAEVAREVRQRAGFGCVVCGAALGDYDHIDPEFADAEIHDPDGIVFLCIACHGKRTRGHLSKQTVMRHAAKPHALQSGFSFGVFDMQGDRPRIHVGSVVAESCENFICLSGRPILSFTPPETANAPFRLNADLADENGNVLLRVVDNEWKASAGTWDVQIKKNRIVFRSAPRVIALEIRTNPPNDFHVTRLNMKVYGYELFLKRVTLCCSTPHGPRNTGFNDVQFSNLFTAIDLTPRSVRLGSGRRTLNLPGLPKGVSHPAAADI